MAPGLRSARVWALMMHRVSAVSGTCSERISAWGSISSRLIKGTPAACATCALTWGSKAITFSPKPRALRRRATSDFPQPNQPQSLAFEAPHGPHDAFHPGNPFPVPRFAVGQGDLASHGQDQSQGVLGDFIRTEVRDVAHHNSKLGSGLKIDVVYADSQAHHTFQMRQRGKKFTRQARTAYHDHVGTLGNPDAIFLIHCPRIADGPSVFANQFFVEATHRPRFSFRINNQVPRHVLVFLSFYSR